MRMLIIILLAAAISLAFAFGGGGSGSSGGGGSSETQPAIVYADQYVHVSSDSGALSGVLVTLSEPGSSGTIASARTDSNGKAYFKLVAGKQVVAHVSVSGFEPQEQSLSASSGTVEMELKKSVRSAGTSEQEQERENERSQFSVRGRPLPCGDGATMGERVRCRLAAATEDYSRLYYVPEECRAEGDSRNRTACLELYDGVQSCRKLEGDGSRFACVRMKLGMNATVNESVRACRASSDSEACIARLHAPILALAKFKLYNLEERAEYLISDGLPREKAEAFIQKMEQLKLDFNAAATIREKRDILKQALSEWRAFKADAIAQIREKEDSS